MSESARAWLAARADSVPRGLEAEMDSAVREVDGERPIAAALAEAARICLLRSLQHGDSRAAALPLLAADALVTYACEAAAAEGTEPLRELAHSLHPSQLANLVPPTATR